MAEFGLECGEKMVRMWYLVGDFLLGSEPKSSNLKLLLSLFSVKYLSQTMKRVFYLPRSSSASGASLAQVAHGKGHKLDHH
jgi:hypothetical protein